MNVRISKKKWGLYRAMALISSLKIDQWSIFKEEVNEYREKKLATELAITIFLYENRSWQSAKKAGNFLAITIFLYEKRSWQSEFL